MVRRLSMTFSALVPNALTRVYYQRCDGARPFCGQCAQTRRPTDCEYTDKQGRTYTEVLEERLSQLKARVQELETPSLDSGPVLLHDPYAGSHGTLSASAVGSAHVSGALSALPPQIPMNMSISRPGKYALLFD